MSTATALANLPAPMKGELTKAYNDRKAELAPKEAA